MLHLRVKKCSWKSFLDNLVCWQSIHISSGWCFPTLMEYGNCINFFSKPWIKLCWNLRSKTFLLGVKSLRSKTFCNSKRSHNECCLSTYSIMVQNLCTHEFLCFFFQFIFCACRCLHQHITFLIKMGSWKLHFVGNFQYDVSYLFDCLDFIIGKTLQVYIRFGAY